MLLLFEMYNNIAAVQLVRFIHTNDYKKISRNIMTLNSTKWWGMDL